MLLDFDGFSARDCDEDFEIESIFSQGKSSSFTESFSENSSLLTTLLACFLMTW